MKVDSTSLTWNISPRCMWGMRRSETNTSAESQLYKQPRNCVSNWMMKSEPKRNRIHLERRVGHPDWLYKKSIQGEQVRAHTHTHTSRLVQTPEACVCLSCNLSFRSLKNDVTECQPWTMQESQPASQTDTLKCARLCARMRVFFISFYITRTTIYY